MTTDQKTTPFHNPFEETLDHIEDVAQSGPVGLPTGFQDLDSLIGGLMPGTLTVVASRPAMGRTTFVTDVLRHTAIKHGRPAALWTLEESLDEFGLRVLCAEARVARRHARSGVMTDEDWTRLARQLPVVTAAPLHIATPATLTNAELAEQAAVAVNEHEAELLVIDGLNDVQPDQRSGLREREVGDTVRTFKAIARKHNVPVLATAHLNRGPGQRFDRRPCLDDLRESGAITFAADTIVMLHREDYYHRLSPRAGEADLILAKHRQGQGDEVTTTVAFQGHYGRFVDMAPEDVPARTPVGAADLHG